MSFVISDNKCFYLFHYEAFMSVEVRYLLPSYNHDRYIENVLDSIYDDMTQLKVSSELIIIDDGSMDFSVMEIEKWIEKKDSKIAVVFFSRENRGLTTTLNELLKYSSSNFIRLCSSDDLIIAGSTNQMYSYFKKNRHLVCVTGDAFVVDSEGNKIHESSIAFHGGNISELLDERMMLKSLIKKWCIAGPSVLIKDCFFKEFMYSDGATIDDFDLYLSLLEGGDKLKIIDEKVSCYRLHSCNTSKTQDINRRIKNLDSFLQIIKKHIKRGFAPRELLYLELRTSAKISYLESNFICASYKIMLAYICLIRT